MKAVKTKRKMGAPTLFGKRMKQTAFFLPEEMVEWIDQQVDDQRFNSRSDLVRSLVMEKMQRHE